MFKTVTYTPISNGALLNDDLPVRIKVLNFGKTDTLDKPIFINDKSIKIFNDNQKKIGRERVGIDFNHNTVVGTEAYNSDKEPRAIAAYGTPVLTSEGLFLENIKWTPSGKKSAKDYEDLSPAPLLDEDGVVVGLHSIALCPAGAISDLHFYSADNIFNNMTNKTISNEVDSKNPLSITETKALSSDMPDAYKNVEPKESTQTKSYMNEEFKKLAPIKLGMKTDAEILEILKSLVAKFEGEESEKEGQITNKENSAIHQFSADFKALQEKVNSLEAKNLAEVARHENAEKQELVSRASRDGKIIPLSADSIKATSFSVLKEIVTNLQANKVPMKATVRALSSDGQPKTKVTLADAASLINEQIASIKS